MQEWWNEPCRQPDEAARIRAMARQDQLTKPRGALGQLEALAVNLAALQACDRPAVERLHLCVFAGDHGVVEEGRPVGGGLAAGHPPQVPRRAPLCLR